jgi:hypothetical protein
VVAGLFNLISTHREPDTEILRFPPVMSRQQLEKSGYLRSFPHLLGCVSALHGGEADIRSAVGEFESGGNWAAALAPTDLVLTPAACYPVYPPSWRAALCAQAGSCLMLPASAFAMSPPEILIACGSMSASARQGRSRTFAQVGWFAPGISLNGLACHIASSRRATPSLTGGEGDGGK